MNNKTIEMISRAAAKASLMATMTLSLLPAMLLAQTSTNPTSPPDGWMQVGQPIHISQKKYGSSDIGKGTVSRQNMQMLLDANLTVYKTKQPVNGYDFFLVNGLVRHAVTGYDSNWLSLGYYGKTMGLTINGNGAYLADYGPQSTLGTDTTSWSVGASVEAEAKGQDSNVKGSASFSFGQSFSSPNVKFETSASADTLSITTRLPGNLGDPKPPSKAGYGYYVAAVFKVPQNRGLTLTIAGTAEWHYEYTRLIVNDKVSALASGSWAVDFTNRPISNGNGACLSVSGSQVVTTTCDFNNPLQQFSYTPAGQFLNTATNSCLDKDPSSNGVVINTCSDSSTTQRYYVGSAGCLVDNSANCVSLLLPGIFTPIGKVMRVPAQAGGQVQIVNPDAAQMMQQYWRVRW